MRAGVAWQGRAGGCPAVKLLAVQAACSSVRVCFFFFLLSVPVVQISSFSYFFLLNLLFDI